MNNINNFKKSAEEVINWYDSEIASSDETVKYAVFKDKKDRIETAVLKFVYDKNNKPKRLQINTYIQPRKITSTTTITVREGNKAYLNSIATFFEYRNTGISSKVLELAQMIFRMKNIVEIYGSFWPNNPFYDEIENKTQNQVALKKQAEIFYKKHKFSIISKKDLKKFPKDLAFEIQKIFESPENFGNNVLYKNIEKIKLDSFKDCDGILIDSTLLENKPGEFGE